ncbi:alpha/beta hydrolase [Waterburya agarophytonicola K14]|uniref:Alpha/beta hydrolase n=1 Tax=Waterburya agarophytonicola KI4 TaxID=2874699 RepID=A0A964BUX5_9CYAN|nr:alpha/beta hydrolase [Waterburya agarophytonicola]MCC0178636.1 alpha/beta hydrolase [Waterburya agarophytonicola KI4]
MSNLNFWWFVLLCISIVGLFLSLWIVIPAPTFLLLTFGVGAPELSPWLIAINAIALFFSITIPKSWLANLILVCSLIALILSCLPLLQLSAADRRFSAEMERVLGTDYLTKIPQDLQQQMRPVPFAIADIFKGISIPEVRIDRGIVFASPDNVDLKLNLYRPIASGINPTLIIIYGGAWRSGSPNDYANFSSYIAAQGYSVINLDYRHAPQYKFPLQLEDVNTALQYIQDNAADLSVDFDKISIMGRSAGGHLATLAAYQPDPIIQFRSVVSYYSPVNLTEGYYDPPVPNPINTKDVLRNFLGGTPEEFPELYRLASPINYPRPNLAPTLLIYGQRDHLVQPKFGRQLYDKLLATDNPAILLDISWAEHAFDVVFFGVSNQLALYYTERFLAFTLK